MTNVGHRKKYPFVPMAFKEFQAIFGLSSPSVPKKGLWECRKSGTWLTPGEKQPGFIKG